LIAPTFIGFSMHATVLFAHGSRDPAWRIPIDRIAARMRAINPEHAIRCAFLELTEPDIFAAISELDSLQVQHVIIVPLFLGIGRHAREDVPKLVTQLIHMYPKITFDLRASIGEDDRVIELLAQLSMPDNLPNTMA
jgi:sirohydrochlorin cobaltochelatase